MTRAEIFGILEAHQVNFTLGRTDEIFAIDSYLDEDGNVQEDTYNVTNWTLEQFEQFFKIIGA